LRHPRLAFPVTAPIGASLPCHVRCGLRGDAPSPQEPERRFDDITRLCTMIFKVPIALVSLLDENVQWFLSAQGLPGVKQTQRSASFCAWCACCTRWGGCMCPCGHQAHLHVAVAALYAGRCYPHNHRRWLWRTHWWTRALAPTHSSLARQASASTLAVRSSVPTACALAHCAYSTCHAYCQFLLLLVYTFMCMGTGSVHFACLCVLNTQSAQVLICWCLCHSLQLHHRHSSA
jgi:hypothetical protein